MDTESKPVTAKRMGKMGKTEQGGYLDSRYEICKSQR